MSLFVEQPWLGKRHWLLVSSKTVAVSVSSEPQVHVHSRELEDLKVRSCKNCLQPVLSSSTRSSPHFSLRGVLRSAPARWYECCAALVDLTLQLLDPIFCPQPSVLVAQAKVVRTVLLSRLSVFLVPFPDSRRGSAVPDIPEATQSIADPLVVDRKLTWIQHRQNRCGYGETNARTHEDVEPLVVIGGLVDLACQAACAFVEIPVPTLTKARNDTILSPIRLPPNDQEEIERVEAPVRVETSVDLQEKVLLKVVGLPPVLRP